MPRVVVLGATGTVGRELVRLLAARGDVEVVAVGRNRVLLEHLEASLPVEVLRFDSVSMPASELPAADVLVDLTFSLNRHPRWVTRSAERSVATLLDYLRLNEGSRVVHTGTFALLNKHPELADELCSKLLWSDSYMLSKSAAERALRRVGPPERVAVIRLGNMAVPDMTWTTAILRAVRDGAVSNPSVLFRPANLTDARQLAGAVFEERAGLTYLPEMAGFTWGEVIGSVATSTGGHFETPAPRRDQVTTTGSALPVGTLVNRALYAAPLDMASGPLEALPGADRWLGAGRGLVRRTRGTAPAFPVALPAADTPIPGSQRDETRLQALTEDLTALFERRGWAPL